MATYIRLRTRTNSTTLPDATLTALAAVHMDTLALRVLDIDEDYFGTPSYADLIASSDNFDNREYSLPTTQLNRLKRVEGKLDGTNWLKLRSFDLRYYARPTDEETVLNQFSNDQDYAFYDIYRNSIWIYSGAITAGTDALKLWSFNFPAHISDWTSTVELSTDPTSTTHGFPRALHPSLCDCIIVDWKQSREKPIPLTEQEVNREYTIRTALSSMRGIDKDAETVGALPGSASIGDNGSLY